MEATARQGLSLALPTREHGTDVGGDVVALQAPTRDSAWPISAESIVAGAQRRDLPVSVVLLRVDIRRPNRFARRSATAPTTADLVRSWRTKLGSDERLIGLGPDVIGLMLPGSSLDEAFTRVEQMRETAGRSATLTAAVSAARRDETLAETSLRAERKLARFARAGSSALAV